MQMQILNVDLMEVNTKNQNFWNNAVSSSLDPKKER